MGRASSSPQRVADSQAADRHCLESVTKNLHASAIELNRLSRGRAETSRATAVARKRFGATISISELLPNSNLSSNPQRLLHGLRFAYFRTRVDAPLHRQCARPVTRQVALAAQPRRSTCMQTRVSTRRRPRCDPHSLMPTQSPSSTTSRTGARTRAASRSAARAHLRKKRSHLLRLGLRDLRLRVRTWSLGTRVLYRRKRET